jgi:hypothetical protein
VKLDAGIDNIVGFTVYSLEAGMKIVLDRRTCGCWDAPCETHFGWHFLRDEIEPIDCTVEIIDDGKPERTFFILDRDGFGKVLVVDETNREEAYDSWQTAWERQQVETSKQ